MQPFSFVFQVKHEEIIEVFVKSFLALSFTEIQCLTELLNLSFEHSEIQPP